MSDGGVDLREFLEAQIATVRREIATLDRTIVQTADVHARAHEREHAMTELAVTKAEEALTIRLEQMNEFREQITSERGTYPTKAELFEVMKRLEDLIVRNATDLESAFAKADERLKAVERFASDAKAQMGTLKALMGVLLFALAVAGFILGMSQ